ncbi:MAG: bifunctional ornithine acetyltransferase/N-acetylglutamate synthase, partial [Spirochaetota bacterium]
GASFRQEDLSVYFNDTALLVKNVPQKVDSGVLAEIMKNSEFAITVHLGAGNCEWTFMTSDISYDYVKINAEYTT